MAEFYAHQHGIQGQLVSALTATSGGALFVVPQNSGRLKSSTLQSFRRPPFDQPGNDPVDTIMVYDKDGRVEVIRALTGSVQGNIISGVNVWVYSFFMLERGFEGTVQYAWPAGTFASAVFSVDLIEKVMAGQFIRQAQYLLA